MAVPIEWEPELGVEINRIDIGEGFRLAVRRWTPPARGVSDGPGSSVPFLLVHGLASNARMWDGVADHLAERGHPVAAVDLRGHGLSDKPDTGYDVATVAGDLEALIGRLPFERPVVVGQSWGGNVVLELGLRAPRVVRGIVGVDGGLIELAERFPDWESCRRALTPPALAGTPSTVLEGRLRSAHPDWPETGIQGALANFEVREDGTVAPWLTTDRHLAILRSLWDHRPSARLATLTVPLLLAPADSGDGAWTAEKRAQVERARLLGADVRVRWFTPADHDVHAQQPEALAAVLHAAATDRFFR